jgi:hypothetical protein
MTMRVTMALAVMLAAGAAQAADANGEPATGVPFKVRHGWYAETQLGVFTTFGGSKALSNGAPFMALSAGTDLPSMPELSLFFTVGHGSNAGSCHALKANGECDSWKLADGSPAGSQGIESFSVIPLEVGARYAFGDIVPRLAPHALVTVGYAIISPEMVKDASLGSAHAGLGGGVEYVTRLDGLTLGAEVLVRAAFGPFLASLAAYPRIKYVF